MIHRRFVTVKNDVFLSFNLLRNNPLSVLLITLLEVVFLFSYGFLSNFFLSPLISNAVSLSQGAFQLIQGDFSGSILSVLFQETTKTFTIHLLFLMIGTGVFTYVWYCLFHGTLWFMTRSLIKEEKFFSYMKRFARVNMLWFTLFFIYFILDLVIDLRRTIIQSITNTPQTSITLIVLAIVLGIMILVALPSYVTCSARSSWFFVTRNWKKSLEMYGVIILLFLALYYVLRYLGTIDQSLMIIIGIITLFPLLAWARTHILLVVETYGIH